MNNLVAAAVEATNFVPVLISVPRAHKTEIISFQIITLCIITRAIVKSRRAAITLISRLLAARLFSEQSIVEYSRRGNFSLFFSRAAIRLPIRIREPVIALCIYSDIFIQDRAP